MTAAIARDDEAGRLDAVRVLREGGIVALPTDTVYGIAAALGSPSGIDRLFAAKGRPADRAIAVLLASAGQAPGLAEWPPAAAALAAAFWPGALTLVLRRRDDVSLPAALTASRPTVGLRVPDHACPRTLAAELGPLPVTSANLSGRPEARDAAAIAEQLADSVDLILDGGPARGGPASTVVDCSGPEIRMLRAGALGFEEIAAALHAAGLTEPAGD